MRSMLDSFLPFNIVAAWSIWTLNSQESSRKIAKKETYLVESMKVKNFESTYDQQS